MTLAKMIFQAGGHGEQRRIRKQPVSPKPAGTRRRKLRRARRNRTAAMLHSRANDKLDLAHPFDASMQAIAGQHRPHPFWRAGHDQITRLQVVVVG